MNDIVTTSNAGPGGRVLMEPSSARRLRSLANHMHVTATPVAGRLAGKVCAVTGVSPPHPLLRRPPRPARHPLTRDGVPRPASSLDRTRP